MLQTGCLCCRDEWLIYNVSSRSWQTVDDPNQSFTSAFGVSGTFINGINDRGDLVGFYSDGTHVNGLLATATPEPASLGLLLTGAGLVISAGHSLTSGLGRLALPIEVILLGARLLFEYLGLLAVASSADGSSSMVIGGIA